VEGTVEPGILAASWSPDDSLLAIVTGIAKFLFWNFGLTCTKAGDKLILMTSTFEVLSEMPLCTSEFGEGLSIFFQIFSH
jgi:elongator complex protein 1